MCLHGTHFPRWLNKLEIIVIKSKQVQARKFPIVISYFFRLDFGQIKFNRLLASKRGTFDGEFIITSRSWPSSHRPHLRVNHIIVNSSVDIEQLVAFKFRKMWSPWSSMWRQSLAYKEIPPYVACSMFCVAKIHQTFLC
jgi:hypothetical protein